MMGFCAPTALMQRAVARLLHYRPPLDAVADRHEMIRANLTSYGYQVCAANATFFVYARSPVADDFAFAETLAQQGVLILPSTLFYEPGYFRVSVTARRESCQRALSVFEQAMINIHGHSHA